MHSTVLHDGAITLTSGGNGTALLTIRGGKDHDLSARDLLLLGAACLSAALQDAALAEKLRTPLAAPCAPPGCAESGGLQPLEVRHIMLPSGIRSDSPEIRLYTHTVKGGCYLRQQDIYILQPGGVWLPGVSYQDVMDAGRYSMVLAGPEGFDATFTLMPQYRGASDE